MDCLLTLNGEDGLLEVKCRFSAKTSNSLMEVVEANHDICLNIKDNFLYLLTMHKYYQIQGQSAITNRHWCDLFVCIRNNKNSTIISWLKPKKWQIQSTMPAYLLPESWDKVPDSVQLLISIIKMAAVHPNMSHVVVVCTFSQKTSTFYLYNCTCILLYLCIYFSFLNDTVVHLVQRGGGEYTAVIFKCNPQTSDKHAIL